MKQTLFLLTEDVILCAQSTRRESDRNKLLTNKNSIIITNLRIHLPNVVNYDDKISFNGLKNFPFLGRFKIPFSHNISPLQLEIDLEINDGNGEKFTRKQVLTIKNNYSSIICCFLKREKYSINNFNNERNDDDKNDTSCIYSISQTAPSVDTYAYKYTWFNQILNVNLDLIIDDFGAQQIEDLERDMPTCREFLLKQHRFQFLAPFFLAATLKIFAPYKKSLDKNAKMGMEKKDEEDEAVIEKKLRKEAKKKKTILLYIFHFTTLRVNGKVRTIPELVEHSSALLSVLRSKQMESLRGKNIIVTILKETIPSILSELENAELHGFHSAILFVARRLTIKINDSNSKITDDSIFDPFINGRFNENNNINSNTSINDNSNNNNYSNNNNNNNNNIDITNDNNDKDSEIKDYYKSLHFMPVDLPYNTDMKHTGRYLHENYSIIESIAYDFPLIGIIGYSPLFHNELLCLITKQIKEVNDAKPDDAIKYAGMKIAGGFPSTESFEGFWQTVTLFKFANRKKGETFTKMLQERHFPAAYWRTIFKTAPNKAVFPAITMRDVSELSNDKKEKVKNFKLSFEKSTPTCDEEIEDLKEVIENITSITKEHSSEQEAKKVHRKLYCKLVIDFYHVQGVEELNNQKP